MPPLQGKALMCQSQSNRSSEIPGRSLIRHLLAAYLWQHFAQPAASLQHAAQVALSPQQLPLHAAADLQLAPSFLQQEEQPVLRSNPTAHNTANVSIFIFDLKCFICPNNGGHDKRICKKYKCKFLDRLNCDIFLQHFLHFKETQLCLRLWVTECSDESVTDTPRFCARAASS